MENKNLNPIYKAIAIAYCLLLHCSDFVGAVAKRSSAGAPPGQWQVLLNNTGVVAMHMALTHYSTVIMFDQTGSGPSNYRLRHRYDGRRCRATAREDLRDPSCYAHSVEYSILDNRIRPLFIQPDPWGSSGSFLSNGTLLETGGFGSGGSKRIRYFRPCRDSNCDWRQGKRHLSDARWYASSLRLPDHDDRVVVVGGRDVFTYEFVPKKSLEEKSFNLPFLKRTYESEGGNNLYPILHLSPDGNLFIFANRDSILFNYKRNKVVKTFPRIPGKGSRTYPSSGSSVLLPLDHDDRFQKAEVMICGGAATGAVQAAREGRFLQGLSSCGRIVITGNNVHKWKMEQMPGPRLMHDMILLPNGNVLIINGVESGCAGANSAAHPVLQPYLYKTKKQLGSRFSLLKPTKVARMYHSSAILLPDGRVLVAGSNPNNNYVLRNVAHPTELRLQAFTPANMAKAFDDRRPINVTVNHDGGVAYGEEFSVKFLLRKKAWHSAHDIVITAYAAPFNTHSISMNQRLLVLRSKNVTMAAAEAAGRWLISADVEAPPSPKVAPAGYYMISVVYSGIPSKSQWVRFMHQ